jgi:coenzyme F420-reducing hydrogenase beta subunit
LINDIKNCSGCGLCYATCPLNAIKKVERERGTVYFQADDNCVKCGKCVKLCPSLKDFSNDDQKTFLSASVKNEDVFSKSSSGGAAYEIAKKIISIGGVVYGAAWDIKSQSVKHIKISTINDICLIQGSKYVQSEIDKNTYEDIVSNLQKTIVLFIGCPCQVAALRSLSNDHPNLYTVDIVCHGVSSPKLLKEQLNMVVKDPINSISFRDGLKFRLRVETANAVYEKRAGQIPYYSLYLNFASLRETCYSCKYANRKRVGDITVGDYIEDGRGNSLIISNTIKGRSIVEDIKKEIDYVERDIDLLKVNHSFNQPTEKPKQTDKFTKFYAKYGLKRAYEMSFTKLVIKRKIQVLVGDDLIKTIKGLVRCR